MTGEEWSRLHRIRGIPPTRRHARRNDARSRQDSAFALPVTVIVGHNPPWIDDVGDGQGEPCLDPDSEGTRR